MQLHKLLRLRDVLPTENETIAELSEEKCSEWPVGSQTAV